MEDSKFTVQLEEISIDKVCRTCLNTSDLMISVYDTCDDDEITDKLSFLELINETFGRIMPTSQLLPNRVCDQCRGIIRKAFDFKKLCMKSIQTLSEALDNEVNDCSSEDKCTQTDQESLQMQFDDENFDAINLQEDVIFDGTQTNPLSMINAQESTHLEKLNYDETFIKSEKEMKSEVVEKSVIEFDYESFSTEPDKDSDDNKPKKIHQCDKCSKCFLRPTHLKRHKLTHEDDRSMLCSVCTKGFTRLDQLNYHMLSSHSDQKPFRCDIPECKKGFLKEEHLRKHIEAKHADTSKDKEVCTLCQKTFSSKKYLKTHMKVHNVDTSVKKDPNNEKPFLCSECGLRFVRHDYLVIHIRRHQGLKPYKCRFCDKGFPRATDLTVHERYHTNEKTHLCNLCGKGFQRAYNLLVHMRVHTGEKPYKCSYCSKSFSQGNDLKAHIRRHTGERFKCDLCSEGFIQGYHLRNHKKAVHGIDIKSHIRRVEKFVNPVEEAAGGELVTEHDLPAENEHQIKVESDYQFQES